MEHPIVFTKRQYEALIRAVQMADSVYGIMGDMVDKKYKKQSVQMDELEDVVFRQAEAFGMGHMVDEFQGKKHMKDGHEEEYMEDLLTFEGYAMWDNLARNLARRDLAKAYTLEQLQAMDHMKYIGLESRTEERYHEEFEEHGLTRLEVHK